MLTSFKTLLYNPFLGRYIDLICFFRTAHPTLLQIDKPPPTSNPSSSSTIPQTYTFQPTTPISQAHYAFPPYPTSLSAPETVASLSPASASTSFRTPPQPTLASTSSLPNSAPNPFGSFKAAPDHSASRAQDASAVAVSEKTKGKASAAFIFSTDNRN